MQQIPQHRRTPMWVYGVGVAIGLLPAILCSAYGAFGCLPFEYSCFDAQRGTTQGQVATLLYNFALISWVGLFIGATILWYARRSGPVRRLAYAVAFALLASPVVGVVGCSVVQANTH